MVKSIRTYTHCECSNSNIAYSWCASMKPNYTYVFLLISMSHSNNSASAQASGQPLGQTSRIKYHFVHTLGKRPQHQMAPRPVQRCVQIKLASGHRALTNIPEDTPFGCWLQKYHFSAGVHKASCAWQTGGLTLTYLQHTSRFLPYVRLGSKN